MTFMSALIFLAGAIGMTLIVCFSDIGAYFKDKIFGKDKHPEFLSCPQCVGFWSGLFCYFFMLSSWTCWIVYGCAASFASVVAIYLIPYFDPNHEIDLDDIPGELLHNSRSDLLMEQKEDEQ